MQQVIVRLLVPAITAICIGLLFAVIDKNNDKELIENLTKEHIVIRLPKAYIWVGVIGILFSLALIILSALFPNGTEGIFSYSVFIAFVLLGIMIVLEALFWRVDIFRHKDYFVYRTMFFKAYTIEYKDCEYYISGTNTIKLKTSSKTFRFDSKSTNIEFLLGLLGENGVREVVKHVDLNNTD